MQGEDKLSIIQQGLSSGVSNTCRRHGISRTLYYRWLKRYKETGLAGLVASGRAGPPHNKTPSDTENRVLALAKRYPRLGPRELMYRLDDIGLAISESAVYNALKRHGLTTRQARQRYARGNVRSLAATTPDFQSVAAGECWVFWLTAFALPSQADEVLYVYTVFDYRTKIACSRVYSDCQLDNLGNLLHAVAIPIAQCLEFDPKHFCLLPSPFLAAKLAREWGRQVETWLNSAGLDAHAHLVCEEAAQRDTEALCRTYTSAISACVLPLLLAGCTLRELRNAVQVFVRNYNLHATVSYGSVKCSPTAYLSSLAQREIVLPMWAYFERDY